MDAIDLVILALRLVFVALLYVFLVVVLRFAVRGLREPPVRARPELRLRVLEPGATDLAAGEVFAVPDGATLGRGERADLVLADTAVSAEHARVARAGRHWTVTDLGSTNGTRVNDTVVRKQAQIANGDVLTVGTVQLQVVAR